MLKMIRQIIATGAAIALVLTMNVAIADDSWRSTDVGNVPAPGSLEVKGDTLVIKGSGQLGEKMDAFHFAHKQVSGNFQWTFRIDAPSSRKTIRTGLMVRASTAPDAAYAGLKLLKKPDKPLHIGGLDGRRFKSGPLPAATVGHTVKVELPAWFRVQRYGKKVFAQYAEQESRPRERDWSVRNFPLRFHADLPETVEVGFIATGKAGDDQAAVFRDVRIEPLRLTHKTSWYGNSFGGGAYHVTQGVWALDVHGPSGIMSTNGPDEFHSAGIYDTDGMLRYFGKGSHFRFSPGTAVDEQFVYHARGNKKGASINVYRHDGSLAPGNNKLLGEIDPEGDKQSFQIGGLAVDREQNRLYATDMINDRVRVIDTGTDKRPEVGSFEVSDPRKIAVATDGTLWIVQYASPVNEKWGYFANTFFGREKNGTPTVLHCTADGERLGSFNPSEAVRSGVVPMGLKVHPETGDIWLVDAGPAQRLHIFSASGKLKGHVGGKGGVSGTAFDTQAGETHPLKFDYPTDLAFDHTGNLYVACTGSATRWGPGGTTLRKFDPAGNMLWQRLGLEFVSCGDADPEDRETVYTPYQTYHVDYDAPPGRGWEHTATHYDPYASPEDPRGAAVKTVRIGGRLFLFMVPMVSKSLHIYRFEGLQTAYCGSFTEEDGHLVLWLDRDGDQRVEEDEKTVARIHGLSHGRLMYVDNKGGVWNHGGGKLYRYLCQGVAPAGHPKYEHEQRAVRPIPPVFTGSGRGVDVRQVKYDPDDDVLYASGYTEEHPRIKGAYHWKSAGSELIRVDDWQAGAFDADEQAPGPIDRHGWSGSWNRKVRWGNDPDDYIFTSDKPGKGTGDSRQRAGQSLTIDMGERTRLSRVFFKINKDSYPSGFELQVSDDGKNYTTVASSRRPQLTKTGDLKITFETVEASHFRLVLTKDAKKEIQIREVRAYWDEPAERRVEPTWRIMPVKNPSSGRHISNNLQAFDHAGDYVFLANNSVYIDVLRATNGKFVTRLYKGPEIAGTAGIMDIQQGMNAFRRDNGKYVIILEDDHEIKNYWFQWNPKQSN